MHTVWTLTRMIMRTRTTELGSMKPIAVVRTDPAGAGSSIAPEDPMATNGQVWAQCSSTLPGLFPFSSLVRAWWCPVATLGEFFFTSPQHHMANLNWAPPRNKSILCFFGRSYRLLKVLGNLSNQSMFLAGKRYAERHRWEREAVTMVKKKNNKRMWQSLDWREISDVWKHIPQWGPRFVIQRVRRQRRGEEKSSEWVISWKQGRHLRALPRSDMLPLSYCGSHHLMFHRALCTVTCLLTSIRHAVCARVRICMYIVEFGHMFHCSVMTPEDKTHIPEAEHQLLSTAAEALQIWNYEKHNYPWILSPK